MLSKIRGEKSEKTKNSKRTKIREKIQNEGGITLIALVVTIIILLILAGVSVQMLLGDQGLIKKAVEAVEKTEIADYEEQLELLGVELAMDEAAGGTGGSYVDKYKEKIEENFPGAQVEPNEDDNSLVVETEEGYVYEVTEEGTEYLGEKGDEGLEELPEDIDTGDLEITIEPDEPTWTQSVEVTIGITDENLEKFSIEYSEDGETWEKYKKPFKVEETETIKARIANVLGDKAEVTTEEQITNIDTVEPGEITIETEPTIDSIKVTAKVKDGEKTANSGQSGIKTISFKKEGDPVWIEGEMLGDDPSAEATSTHTFSELTQEQNCTIYVKATDKAGNETEKSITNKTNKIPDLNETNDELLKIEYDPPRDDWTNGNVNVKLTGTYASDDQYTLQYATDYKGNEEEAEWKDYKGCQDKGFDVTENGKIGIRLISGDQHGEVKEDEITWIDRDAPNLTIKDPQEITTNSIKVEVEASDVLSKLADENPIDFYIILNELDTEKAKQQKGDAKKQGADTSFTFEDLKQATTYTILVEATDNANNTAYASKVVRTTSVPNLVYGTNITYTYVPNDWTNKPPIKVTLEPKENIDNGWQLQYKVGDDGSWVNYSESAFDVSTNGKIYTRLKETNGEQFGGEAKYDLNLIDTEPPTVTLEVTSNTTNSLVVKTTASEGTSQSGLHNTERYKYSIYQGEETTGDALQTTEASTDDTATFTGLTQNTKYTVKVTVKDNAGNTKDATATQTIGKVPQPTVGTTGGSEDIIISYAPPTWTSEAVRVTITKKEGVHDGFNIQYATKTVIETPREDEWQNYNEGGFQVSQNKTTVYVRLSDGTNGGKVATATGTVANIDRKQPTPVTLNKSEEETTDTTIGVTATAQDAAEGEGSGVSGIKKFVFYYKEKSSEGEFTQSEIKEIGTPSPNTDGVTQTFTYTNLKANTQYTLKVEASDQADNKTDSTELDVTTDASQEEIPPLTFNESNKATYADLNGDNQADAVIYADLKKGGTGNWDPNNGNTGSGKFTIPSGQEAFKKYKVVKDNYEGKFGTGQVIAAEGEEGADRFYAMGLGNIGNTYYPWWNTSSVSANTNTNFGTGKQNTKTMLDKYGKIDTGAIWGLSELRTKCTTGTNGHTWFVPSRGEWAAFGCNLGIDKSNYSSKGLNTCYWSSSVYDSTCVWNTSFVSGSMNHPTNNLNADYYVRLSVTF